MVNSGAGGKDPKVLINDQVLRDEIDPDELMKIEGNKVEDLDRMYEAFKSNIINGYGSTMIFRGKAIHLTCEDKKGFIGLVRVIE